MKTERLYGMHALEAARASGRTFFRLYVHEGRHGPRLETLCRSIEGLGVPVFEVSRTTLDRMAGGGVHQGVLAEVEVLAREGGERLGDWLEQAGEKDVILALDGIQDPRNLGACLRSAAAFGVSCVVLPRHRAAPVNALAVKAASGGAEAVACLTVPNLARALREIREAGFWLIGLDPHASRSIEEGSFSDRTALVLGGEGEGLKRITLELCQDHLRIPMVQDVDSLNVSVAAGIALYALTRGRRDQSIAPPSK